MYHEFWVRLLKDEETGEVVAEIPTLDIADYGPDSQNTLRRLKSMVTFHVESLLSEAKPIPQEKRVGEGLYLRVRHPASVA